MSTTLDLDTLNGMNRADFTARLGDIFEHSPWIAERAWDAKPFADVDQLHQAMVAVVGQASKEEQLALLRAHPELAGREAQADELTAASRGEQAGAGLNRLSREEMANVARLNAEYRQKFGFPFIIAVRRHTKWSIFAEWGRRLANDPDSERQTCLEQVYIIARLRLDSLFGA